VAQFYYYPGWWEGGPMLHNFINLERWGSLPPAYRSILRTASAMANEWMQARYDAGNPAALKRLVAGGAQLRPFPQAVMDASLRAALDLYAEVSRTNAEFKKVYEAMLAFRNDQYLYWQVAELSYDSYLVRTRTRT
jgi:TRAP-type mannitol/chloroaromatic compound transport system substrate-binding protein